MPTNIHGSAVLSLSNSSNNFTSLAWGILKANFWEFEFDPHVQSWLAVCIGWVTGSLIKQWSKRRKNELDEPSPTKLSASQTILTMTHIQLHNKSPNKLHLTLNCVKLIMDRWTLGIFFELFFGPIFGPFFGPFYWGGGATISALGGVRCSLSVLREGWEADCCYSGRGGRRTISTQGGMGGGYRSKCYWLMEFLLDHTNFLGGFSTEYFLCQTFWAGLLVWTFLLSCECESAT